MLAALLLAADTVGALLGPGVSLALAEHRARTLGEVRYALDLDVTARDSAVGRVVVEVDRRPGAGDLILDFRGRGLAAIAANGHPVPVTAWNGAHILVPATLLRPGPNRVELAFTAAIAPSGASIIRFHDPSDGADFLYTLLVPADANQLFPCFDQPDLKARVTLRLRTPAGWAAVANGGAVAADAGAGTVLHRFAETRPISTYLVAFAAGPWSSAELTHGGRTLRAFVRPSRAAEADLDSLLLANARALDWMETYFGIPYPFGKYDFVLAPAFPFGGMEHPGAVFYNEDTFIFRERPTPPRYLGRLATILHEVAHQWFGDLVTMRWFDDLWLKEGFATYMASKALADLEPAAGAWKTFYLRNKPSAYAVDQSAGTTPVWQRLANLDQAKSNYGAIVYNKAPAVLKQLEVQVGEEAFREGVRAFLQAHAFGNATWRDLLAAIGNAAGRPLDDWGRHYILRPGMPALEPRPVARGGRLERLDLVQRPVRDLSGPGPWPIRTTVLLGWAERPPQRLPAAVDDTLARVAVPPGTPVPDFVFVNADDPAYVLAGLDPASAGFLVRHGLGGIADPLLRAMLWGALWDRVRATRLAPVEFVRLAVRDLPAETDEQLAPVLLGRLARAVGAYLAPADRSRELPGVERMLWERVRDPSRPYGIRKAALDAFIDLAATPWGRDRLAGLLRADSAAGEPLRDPTRWAAVTRLRVLDAPGAEAALAAQAARDTTPDGRRRAFVAGAARRDAAAKREYFRRYFADSTLNEDWASGSLGAFNAPEHHELTRPFLRAALDSLQFIQANRRIFFLGGWLGAFLGGQTDARALATVEAWLRERRDLPEDLRLKVLQAADELERTVAIRRRWGG
jgi:aminopeptidase N